MPLVTPRAGRPILASFADRRFRTLVWLVVAVVGWTGVPILAAALQAKGELGFDLELVLEAGRRVTSGASPYDPAVVAGVRLEAQDLFYSYPPPLGQAAAIVARVPSIVILVGFGILAVLAFLFVALRIVGRLAPSRSNRIILLPLVAVLPFLYPLTVALLFGNADAWYPALYGAMLLAALPGASRGELTGAGAALALTAVAKIHPSSIGLWFLLRTLTRAGRPQVVAVAIVTGLAIISVSLIVGGLQPWLDYVAVVRTVSGAELVLRNNIGPAAQLAGLLGVGEEGARLLQLPVIAIALGATAWAALRLNDPVESLAIATVASLVILPVTWYHYPVAVIPFGLAAYGRAGESHANRVVLLLGLAVGIAAVSIALPVTVWLAVGLVLAAIRASAPDT